MQAHFSPKNVKDLQRKVKDIFKKLKLFFKVLQFANKKFSKLKKFQNFVDVTVIWLFFDDYDYSTFLALHADTKMGLII